MFLSPFDTLSIMLALFWLLLFLQRADLRTEMLTLSVIATALLPITFTLATDPLLAATPFAALSVSNLLFSFSLAGLAGVIFHVFFGKHYHNLPHTSAAKQKELTSTWFWHLLLACLLFVWATLLLHLGLSLPVGSALFLSAIALTIYMVSHRHDLLADALVSALLLTFIVFLASQLASLFGQTSVDFAFTQSTSYLGNVSVELILWSFGVGLFLGPVYEFTRKKELT